MSLKKSEVLLRGLREKLVLRLPSTYIFTDSVDSAGAPVLTVAQDSTWGTTDVRFVIRISPNAQLGVNVLGLPQESFAPHTCEVITEASGTATKTFVADAIVDAVLFEVFRLGTAVKMYLMPTTTQPAVAGMIAANLSLALDDLREPGLITV